MVLNMLLLTDLIILAPKSGDFFMDIVFPAVAGAVIFALIFNSLLNNWGYSLW